MKIVFMGAAHFAVPSLQALIDSPHEIIEVVCQPDRPAGRGLKMTACPVGEKAKEAGLVYHQPESLKGGEEYEHLAALSPDLIVVVAYGKILPREIIDIPPLGCVNVHASLLPKYRGAAPINWAIINGEAVTGVTTMLINERMDAGDILLSCETAIDDLDNALELEERLSVMGAELLIQTIEGIENKAIEPILQDESEATYARMLKKSDGLIDWSLSAQEIADRVRGLVPWPVAYTHMDGKLLKIFEAHVSEELCDETPGTVVTCDKHLAIATGKGIIYPIEVQLEGKKKMHCEDMLRGCKIKRGTIME